MKRANRSGWARTLILVVVLAAAASCSRSAELGSHQAVSTEVDPESAHALFRAARSGDKEGIRLALSMPSSPSIDWRFRGRCQTALAIASDQDHLDAVRYLIEKSADPDVPDNTGAGALMWASTMGRTELVRLLIYSGANPNGVNERYGWVPLICAADRGHLNVVRELVAAGANVNAQIVDGNTATSWARKAGHEWPCLSSQSIGRGLRLARCMRMSIARP